MGTKDTIERERARDALLTNGQAVDLTTGQVTQTAPATLSRRRKPVDDGAVVATAREAVNASVDSKSGSFVGYLLRNHEARANAATTIRAMLKEQHGGEGWRGLYAVPPGSPLEIVLDAFNTETNIPLEIPFFAFLHYVSGVLLNRGVELSGPIGTVTPEMWTVILAPSGAGKTFADGVIGEASPVKSNFSEAVSGAAFFDQLRSGPWHLWTQDEIAQKLKQIEDPRSPLGEVKEYLLRTYDNRPIERNSKKEGTLRVERPTLGILGLNTHESFKKALSAESLLDGFAQRFGFVWAERDPNRPFEQFPVFNRPKILAACQTAFGKIVGTTIHQHYTIGPGAEKAFAVSFGMMARGFENDESYFRRAMFRAFKYALIYHVIRGQESSTLDAESIGWGARAAYIHLSDMGKILSRGDTKAAPGGIADITRKVERVQAWADRRKREGKPINPREISRGLSGISTEEAKLLFDMVNR